MKILTVSLSLFVLAIPQASEANASATAPNKLIPIPREKPNREVLQPTEKTTTPPNSTTKLIPIPRPNPRREIPATGKEAPLREKTPTSDSKKTKPKSQKKLVLNSCKNKVEGEYQFGEAGSACSVETYEDESNAISKYQDVIFDERKNENTERSRYVSNLIKLIGDSSDAYYKQRKPKATTQEVATFRRAFLALAHQESFFSHYRISEKDDALKVMKGDQYQSFGLVQLHSKWHRNMVLKTKAWTLSGNIAYGLDLYFQAWQKAGKEKCVDSLEHKARSAYSIYNAGPKKGCRWKNPRGDKFAHNDKNFYTKYKEQAWSQFVNKTQTSKMKTANLVSCVLDNGGSCR
jgi:hypothetical protein